MATDFRKANKRDAALISGLAEQIWWPTYSPLLSKEQIAFMLADMYSTESLRKQMQAGIEFLILDNKDIPIGFAGFEYPNSDEGVFKLHKLYILPSEQGKGTGQFLIEKLISMAKEHNSKLIELNVNRANPAFGFYKKTGFNIYEIVDTPYYQFVLNDYVMRKVI